MNEEELKLVREEYDPQTKEELKLRLGELEREREEAKEVVRRLDYTIGYVKSRIYKLFNQ